MDTTNEFTFKEDALYIIDLLKLCIEKKGFNENVRKEINLFFETDYEDCDPQIEKEIASVYMLFLAKTNFKNVETLENKQHLQKLIEKLKLIEENLI